MICLLLNCVYIQNGSWAALVRCWTWNYPYIKKLRKINVSNCSSDEVLKKKVFSACHFTNKDETWGRKRATSHKFDKLPIRKSKKKIFFSSEDLKRELNAPVISRTIRNRLIAKDLWAHSASKVPYLSKKNICNRKIFAKKRLLRENWKNVLWSDETKVNLLDPMESSMYDAPRTLPMIRSIP